MLVFPNSVFRPDSPVGPSGWSQEKPLDGVQGTGSTFTLWTSKNFKSPSICTGLLSKQLWLSSPRCRPYVKEGLYHSQYRITVCRQLPEEPCSRKAPHPPAGLWQLLLPAGTKIHILTGAGILQHHPTGSRPAKHSVHLPLCTLANPWLTEPSGSSF